jgi:hypothetical protein
MSQQGAKSPLPILFALELLGTAMLFVGILEIYGKVAVVPDAWKFPNYGWVMAVVGFLLGLPHLFVRLRNSANRTPPR